MAKRLGGRKRTLAGITRYVSDLVVWQHASMDDALKAFERCWLIHWKQKAGSPADVVDRCIPRRAMNGDPERLARALADSEELVIDAISADPRLARKSEWHRGEEGDYVCPALLSEGDDSPCFYRRRQAEARANGSDPIKIVISTDDNDIVPRTAAAFIATIKLVQQWRPVEVWWQGSWLNDNNPHVGYVFHVPLITGDMDFSRLEFCISDNRRDRLSWKVMVTHACEVEHASWSGCSRRGQCSYLDGAQYFVSHQGIAPTGESIAANAAQWLELGAIHAAA